MRTLPAGWPDPNDPDQTAFTVYLHVLGDVWPPASTQDGESLPDGWTIVGEWSIDCDLDAPLMPGQVNSGSTFTVASGSCTIPQPEGGLLAPWRVGNERTPPAGRCVLVASHNGYNGSTAFVLGEFLLDPIKGKVSEPFLTLSLVQDLVRLRKRHDIKRNAGASPASPTRYLEQAATNNGYLLDSSADFDALLTSLYFPGKTDELTALQSIVGANLGALYLSMDGTTIVVKDPDYLLGLGTVDATLDVLDSFEDLSWSQDPNAAVDRIEVTFLPPSYDDTPYGPFPFDAAVVWSAPAGASIAAGETKTFDFDPGTDIAINGLNPWPPTGFVQVPFYANSSKDGTGSIFEWDAFVSADSSGSYTLMVTNETGSTKYLVAPYDPPGGGVGTTDYPKGTRSFITGTINGAKEGESSRQLVWGVASEDATNTLTIDLGRNIQRDVDAQAILDRIVTRVTSPTYVIDDVRVVPDVRRELADLYRVQLPEVGFDTRAIVTGIKTSGGPGGIEQSLTIASLGLILMDFDAAWDAAHPGATLDDFDAAWDAAFPGATITDFDRAPLTTT